MTDNTPAAQPDDAELSKLFMQLDVYHITIGEAYEKTCAILHRREAAAVAKARKEGIGIGYTLASGNLYTDIAKFHAFTEELMGGPIWTHQFGSKETWDIMRKKYEEESKAELQRHAQEGGAGE